MDELLDQLKSRITALLTKQGQLLQEKQHSQDKHTHLQSEKRLLQEKHQHAISQIERMIARLKLLEKSQL
jgi:uncharacterized protein (TIGR02449 family)